MPLVKGLILGAFIMLKCITIHAGQNSTHGPNFDCNKAKSQAEKLICQDAELSSLDVVLADLFHKAKNIKGENRGVLIARTKQAWLEREENCKTIVCLQRWYASRIVNMKVYIDMANSIESQATESSATEEGRAASRTSNLNSVQKEPTANTTPQYFNRRADLESAQKEATVIAKSRPADENILIAMYGKRFSDGSQLAVSLFGEKITNGSRYAKVCQAKNAYPLDAYTQNAGGRGPIPLAVGCWFGLNDSVVMELHLTESGEVSIQDIKKTAIQTGVNFKGWAVYK